MVVEGRDRRDEDEASARPGGQMQATHRAALFGDECAEELEGRERQEHTEREVEPGPEGRCGDHRQEGRQVPEPHVEAEEPEEALIPSLPRAQEHARRQRRAHHRRDERRLDAKVHAPA